jgi:hypothetical protein
MRKNLSVKVVGYVTEQTHHQFAVPFAMMKMSQPMSGSVVSETTLRISGVSGFYLMQFN